MKRVFPVLGILTAALLSYALYEALVAAPTEQTMGDVQRIFYYHVSSAWTAFLLFTINFVASVVYLIRRSAPADAVAVVTAEVGVVFCTVVLVTGPLWARPVWGIWWTWDARLTSTFVLWLLYVSYLLLRTLVEEPDRRALLSALFGIFAFLDVPLVFGAIRWWRTQHPQPVIMGSPGSGLEPTMRKVFFFTVLAMHALMALLVAERYLLEKLRGGVDDLKREAEAQ